MDKYRAIPQGYMTVGEVAKKNGRHGTDIATLRSGRLAFSLGYERRGT